MIGILDILQLNCKELYRACFSQYIQQGNYQSKIFLFKIEKLYNHFFSLTEII